MIKSFEIEGWVYKKEDRMYNGDLAGMLIGIRMDKEEEAGKPHQHVLFDVSKKNYEKVPKDLVAEDKVRIKFLPWTKEGVSQKTGKDYAFSTLMLQEIFITEKVPKQKPEAPEMMPYDDPDTDEDVPF